MRTSTEPQAILRIVATAGTTLVAVILLTYWPTYNYLVLDGRAPLFYYMLSGVVALPLLFLRPSIGVRLLREPMVWWFLTYAFSGMAWLLLSQDFPGVAGQQWRTRVLAGFFFFTILLSASLSKPKLVTVAVVACVALAAALNWFDILYPLALVPAGVPGANPGRGAGLFINANGAAAFILMGTIAALPYAPERFRAALLLLAVLGVAPTFSRFGWIFSPLLIVLAIGLKLLNRRQVLVIGCAIPLLIAGAGAYYEFVLQTGNENLLGRLAWFQTFGDHADFSARERAHVAHQAWERFLDSPLYGQGIGVTVSHGARVGTHNMYALLMAEQGLVGLALYLSLLGLLAYKGWQLARTAFLPRTRDVGLTMVLYAAFLGAYGFVSHTVLDDAHGMFILAFIVAMGLQAAWHEPRATSRADP